MTIEELCDRQDPEIYCALTWNVSKQFQQQPEEFLRRLR